MKWMLSKAALLSMGLTLAAQANADIAVIANPAAENLSAADVKNAFMGKLKQFPSGQALTIFDQAQGSPVREGFYQAIAQKSGSQMKAYWASMIFSGKGKPPRTLKGDLVVKGLVASDPSAISYIDASAVDDSVKVLATYPGP